MHVAIFISSGCLIQAGEEDTMEIAAEHLPLQFLHLRVNLQVITLLFDYVVSFQLAVN